MGHSYFGINLLNIVLFTPVNTNSAIANVSNDLVREFNEAGNNVFIVNTENFQINKEGCFPNLATFIRPDEHETILSKVSDADIILYQIGDNYAFHGKAIDWLLEFPGIVILHDYFLGNLLNGLTLNCESISNKIFQETYNVSKAYIIENPLPTMSKAGLPKPLFSEWIALRSVGIVIHSSDEIEYFEKLVGGKVLALNLFFNFKFDQENVIEFISKTEINKQMVLTFGYLNEDRGIHHLIETLSQNHNLRDNYYLLCAGTMHMEYKNRIEALALANKIDLILMDAVTDEVLASLIKEASIVNCLRNPVFQTGSASLLTSLSFGKPTLVHNHKHYSSIPSEAVMKVELGKEIEFISKWLLKLTETSDFTNGLRIRALNYYNEVSDSSSYSRRLLNYSIESMKYLEVFYIKSDIENYLIDSKFSFVPKTYLDLVTQKLRNKFS